MILLNLFRVWILLNLVHFHSSIPFFLESSFFLDLGLELLKLKVNLLERSSLVVNFVEMPAKVIIKSRLIQKIFVE